MKILITGSQGQLGTALSKTLVNDQLDTIDLPQLDLRSYYETGEYLGLSRPELVIHCAAKTNVDDCETNPLEAYESNVIATRNLVNSCQKIDAELVYISTDYVFDGLNLTPYQEYDCCNPLNIYGKTKLIGEEIVKTHLSRFYIVRTAWLFGDHGHNFVKTILQKIARKEPLQIVDDQKGNPTYATDLAKAIDQLIRTKAYGIYHITNEGSCTWYQFARLIATTIHAKEVSIEPTSTVKLNRKALRPQYSVLAKNLLTQLKISMPTYEDALNRFIRTNHWLLAKLNLSEDCK